MLSSIVRHTVLGVIPARFASSRFPGKPLAVVAGKSMLRHVWERASLAGSLSRLLIATDDDRIFAEARRFGAMIRMTSPEHSSGTERVAEVAASDSASLVVNIQGDEPLIEPTAIDAAVNGLIEHPECDMCTLKKRIQDQRELVNPNVVKVVTSLDGNAIYFSRLPIPYETGIGVVHYKHIGLYVYRRDFLLRYAQLPAGPLEKAERLEQLRALENGCRIHVVETDYDSIGVDTPEDLERVADLLAAGVRRTMKNHG
jgi:3-deoxy-manno-octulosonate cytidylyltransferase (CMP-KDO synthetase)